MEIVHGRPCSGFVLFQRWSSGRGRCVPQLILYTVYRCPVQDEKEGFFRASGFRRPPAESPSVSGVGRGAKTSGIALYARNAAGYPYSMKSIAYCVYREDEFIVAQCLNVEVSSFGSTRGEAVANLKEAVELYFEGE